MKKTIRNALLAAGMCLAITGTSNACQFDTDCGPGGECLKADGSLYGACIGGRSPANEQDQQPVNAPSQPRRNRVDTCQFNTDCGPASICFKVGGIYGTCLGQR